MASTNNCSLILSQFSDFKIIKYSNVTLKKNSFSKSAFEQNTQSLHNTQPKNHKPSVHE